MDAYVEKPLDINLGTHSARAAIRVASVHGREAISDLYRFDVHVVAFDEGDGFEAAVLSAPATLMLVSAAGLRRSVYGIVADAALEGQINHGWHGYRLRIVPRLWLLKRRKNSRVFQDMTVVDIVTGLLAEHSIAYRWRVQGPYLPRAYCVQYRETDYAFVTRLLADEGLFFYFDHPTDAGGDDNRTHMGGREVLVLSDTAAYYPKLDQGDELSSCHDTGPGMVPREDQVFGFRARRRIKSHAALVRGYDFRRPTLDLGDVRVAPDFRKRAEEKGMPAERHPVAPEDAAQLAAPNVATRVRYEHEGSYEAPPADPSPAVMRLEQERARVETAEGNSLCRWLIPGQTFTLHDHFSASLNQAYVVTSIEHEAYAAEVLPAGRQLYSNRFECAPAVVRFRPRAPARRLQQTLESAVVVGPKGEEIHTDEHGRVKVLFHWDREGKHDDRSSCWLRVMQAWGGAAWGTQFVPRVGMEVMVSFVGGDVDAPVVAGCVYNATHPLPFKLPAEKTRSGIRTQTTPGGGGFNELSFEDRKGEEEIALHAQGDLNERVRRSHLTSVGGSQTLTVGGSQTVSVGGPHCFSVDKDATATTYGNRTEETRGNASEHVAKTKTMTVDGSLTESVGGRASMSVAETCSLRVAGHYTAFIGSNDGSGSAAIFARESYSAGTDGMLNLIAKKGLVLECGSSRIELKPDSVRITGKALVLSGEQTSLMGKGPALHLTDEAEMVAKTVRIFSAKASLELGQDASLRGELVKLNCDDAEPDPSAGDVEKEETKPLDVKLTDENLKPYAGKTYHLVVDGKKLEGKTGGDGRVTATVPKTAKTVEVELWIEEFPTGKRRHWTMDIAGELPPAKTVRGAQVRLSNVGYYAGKLGDALDDDTRKALRSFQEDHDLERTGDLDDPTVAKLSDMHGH
jgi:type VI secretion system secreted protein VgrG